MGTNSKNNCLSLETFTGISGNRFSQQGLSEQQIQKVYTKKRNPWSGALKTFVILFSLGLFSLQASAQLIGGSAISAGGEGNYGVIDGAASGTADVYGPAARKAWLALVSRIDEEGNVQDVCVGTNKAFKEVGPDLDKQLEFYIDRNRDTGDLHGQAPVLWTAMAMLK